jgi:hypothetical protein
MIIERLVEKIPVRSNLVKLIIGSMLTALAISLGMVGILALFDLSINPAIPSALAAIGAALYAARARE